MLQGTFKTPSNALHARSLLHATSESILVQKTRCRCAHRLSRSTRHLPVWYRPAIIHVAAHHRTLCTSSSWPPLRCTRMRTPARRRRGQHGHRCCAFAWSPCSTRTAVAGSLSMPWCCRAFWRRWRWRQGPCERRVRSPSFVRPLQVLVHEDSSLMVQWFVRAHVVHIEPRKTRFMQKTIFTFADPRIRQAPDENAEPAVPYFVVLPKRVRPMLSHHCKR